MSKIEEVAMRFKGWAAESGDSGSLVCFRPKDDEPMSFGILFAVSADRQLIFVMPIDKVLSRFGVTLVSGHNV